MGLILSLNNSIHSFNTGKFVLDQYTGAAAAYSLRQLSVNTTNVVRVRRSVDNAEADFTADEITDGTLTSFVGSENLADWSENFGNFDSPLNVTLSSGVSDPFGGTDATELISSSDGWVLRDVLSHIQSGTQYTVSIYARAKTEGVKNGFRFILGSATSSNIETTTTWTRYTATITANGTACGILRTSPNSFAEIEIYGFQINEGTSAQSYAATNGTYLNGDGHVTTWYDQAGNSNDATQATAASQPKIVDAGVLVEDNGKPAVDFDGVDDYLNMTSSINTSIYSNFAILKRNITLNNSPIIANSTGQSMGIWSDGNIYENNGSNFLLTTYTNNTNQNLFSIIKKGNTLSDFSANQNGASLPSYSGTAFTSIIFDRIGGRASSYLNGNIQEIVLYPSDQSSNRTGIETNINDHYNIYP